MRVLLDECVPRQLKGFISNHEVVTTQELGWRGIRNGRLLDCAEEEGFSILITCDKNIPYQQRLAGRCLAIVQLPTNRLSELRKLHFEISETVARVELGKSSEVKKSP